MVIFKPYFGRQNPFTIDIKQLHVFQIKLANIQLPRDFIRFQRGSTKGKLASPTEKHSYLSVFLPYLLLLYNITWLPNHDK